MDVVGAQHNIDVAGPLLDPLAVLLGQTARHRYLDLGALSLEGLELAEMPIELVVGVLTNAAGIEDDDIGLLQRRGLRQPVGLEKAGDALGVVFVHLTSVGTDEV